MAISSISAIINDDIHKVWDIVFAVDKYLSLIHISEKKKTTASQGLPTVRGLFQFIMRNDIGHAIDEV